MQRKDFRFAFPFRVRYSEVDGQSVVFNAHYLTYFDTAITEFFRWLGYDYVADVKATGVDFHTVKSVVEYKAPIRFDEEIEVGVRIGHIGNSSLRFDLVIFEKHAGDLRATGEIVWVYTDQKTHKTVRVSDSIRDMLAKAEPAPAG
ncbi:MAG: acyl-CoA thioesterase [Rhodoblastus sp.]